MERRQVVSLIIGPAIGSGVATAIAALNASLATYRPALVLISAICFSFSVGVWLCLLVTAAKSTAQTDKGFLRTTDGGRLLYRKASEELRRAMRSFVPDGFNSIDDAAKSYFEEGCKAAGVQLYGRRGDGLPLEAISPDEIELNAFEAAFGSDKLPVFDVSIKSQDIKKALRHYDGV